MPNLKFLAETVPEIWSGPKNRNVGHVTPSRLVIMVLAVTPCLDFSAPICLFSRFLVQNVAWSRDL